MAKVKSIDWFIQKYGKEIGTIKFNKNLLFRNRNKHKYSLSENEIIAGNAIKCKECGKILSRIQHTHFKYSCLGKISSIKEYMQKYPDAISVAPNLAKKTAVTKENILSKYGEEAGLQKWTEYCERQKYTNSLEYFNETKNFSMTDFEKYNKSRANTLQNYIKRYGEESGLKKWVEYCERQKYTNSLEYFIQKYGEINGFLKYNNFCKDRFGTFISSQEREIKDFLIENKIEHETQFILKGCKGAYDFNLLNTNIIIEFYGDYWHCNPQLYNKDFFHSHKQLYASKIWENDLSKRLYAQEKGFIVIIIWESDWKLSKSEILNKIKEYYAASKI